MKAKTLFLALAVGVVVLVVAVAFLGHSLFSVNVEPQVSARPVAATPEPPQVLETVVDADDAAPPAAPKTAKPTPPPQPESLVAEAPQPAPALPPASGQPGVGAVISLRGAVLATAANKTRRTLVQDGRVFQNDQIDTGPESKLKIKFDDGSVLSQGENTTLVIDEYVYNPAKAGDCGFAMRIIKGTGRIITGLITKVNPNRFKIHTRMATVGIRGCDVAFRNRGDRDDVYVLELGGEKMVSVTAARDGSPLVDPATGRELPIADAKKQTVDIVEGGNLVSVMTGKGIVEQRRMSQDEIREVVGETSYLPPARHDLRQSPDGATFTLQPGQAKPAPDDGSEKAR